MKKRGTIQVKGKGEMVTYWIRSTEGDSHNSSFRATKRHGSPLNLSRESDAASAGVLPDGDVLPECEAAAADIEISLDSPIPLHHGDLPFLSSCCMSRPPRLARIGLARYAGLLG